MMMIRIITYIVEISDKNIKKQASLDSLAQTMKLNTSVIFFPDLFAALANFG